MSPAPTAQGGGRGVPDVAGDADPVTGYQVLIDGSSSTFGGTSALPRSMPAFSLGSTKRYSKREVTGRFRQPGSLRNPTAFRECFRE